MNYVKETIYKFMCDHCHITDDTEDRTLAEALVAMRIQGWKIGREENTCPDCQRIKKEEHEQTR